jgi:hypothetical protein
MLMLALVVKKKIFFFLIQGVRTSLYASLQLIYIVRFIITTNIHSEANLMQRKFLPPLGTTSSARKRFLKGYLVCVYILHGKA